MPVFIAAEAGVNHLGDRKKMLAFCDAAKACGADAVKFQAYKSGNLVMRRKITDPETIMLLERAELTDADLDAIAAHCKANGFKWFASVFDPSQVERVLSRGACTLKIGHKESGWDELRQACFAVGHIPWVSNSKFVPYSRNVWCVEEYPASSTPRLRNVGPFRVNEAFPGFSSHYTDYRIPAAAALRGAEYIEFHLKLSDQDPEAAWSLSVEDATKCCKLIREYSSWL